MFGLSKERPILDHHPKAHIHEIRRISWNLADFVKSRISPEIHPQPCKVRCFNKKLFSLGVHGGGYDPGFHEIQGHSPSPAFIKLDSFWLKHLLLQGFGWIWHEIRRISCGFQSKDPLARNCNPMFLFLRIVLHHIMRAVIELRCGYMQNTES